MKARYLARERKCDIYVIGAANVGKSSIMNRISDRDGGDGGGSGGGGGGRGNLNNR